MCHTPDFVPTQVTGLIEIAFHKNVSNYHVGTKTKCIMDVYPGIRFYATIANFGNVDVHLPEYRKVGELADAPVKIIYIKNERFQDLAGAPTNTSDSSAQGVHYNPTLTAWNKWQSTKP